MSSSRSARVWGKGFLEPKSSRWYNTQIRTKTTEYHLKNSRRWWPKSTHRSDCIHYLIITIPNIFPFLKSIIECLERRGMSLYLPTTSTKNRLRPFSAKSTDSTWRNSEGRDPRVFRLLTIWRRNCVGIIINIRLSLHRRGFGIDRWASMFRSVYWRRVRGGQSKKMGKGGLVWRNSWLWLRNSSEG